MSTPVDMHTGRILFKLLRCAPALLCVLTVFVALPRGAFACSCMMPPEPQVARESAAAVFAGRVVSIVDRSMGIPVNSASLLVVTFQVNTVWKGDAKPALEVVTARNGAACGYAFELGRDYIVYAFMQDGELDTNMCSRTALLADARADIAAFGDGQPVAQPAPGSPMLTPWVVGGLVVAAVLALIVFASGLFVVWRKQE